MDTDRRIGAVGSRLDRPEAFPDRSAVCSATVHSLQARSHDYQEGEIRTLDRSRPGVESSRHRVSLREPRTENDVDAVLDLRLSAKIRGMRNHVIVGAELGGIDAVWPAGTQALIPRAA